MSFKSPQTLMIQGTTSDAGKSVMVAAFCRILAKSGYSVAPFKPQNMALNSAVTEDGGEIGRAQAVQAEAAGVPASILMNPVLLKPNTDIGAQVIVKGRAIGNMDAQAYHAYKPELLDMVVECHHQLQEKYPVVMVEGAGSPAEINLRENDIANMGFAEVIDCPVIIVADIDKGGVFAHLYGTLELLSETEKSRVKGFIINRFRGDVSLLEPGLDWLEEKTGVPVLGVVPYLHNLHIESEDSIQNQSLNDTEGDTVAKQIKVVVIVYPRISNHTDFDALRAHPDVDFEFIQDLSQFKGADLIILPGSKNVRGDLDWLESSGWKSIVQKHLRFGGKLIGICGGYQMLGDKIHDPEGIESAPGSSDGLSLIPMETILEPEKTLGNVQGQSLFFGEKVSGYEIHAGISSFTSEVVHLHEIDVHEEKHKEGVIDDNLGVMGTYLHGVFDQPAYLQSILNWAGVEEAELHDYTAYRASELDRLAEAVESAIGIDKIEALLSLDKH